MKKIPYELQALYKDGIENACKNAKNDRDKYIYDQYNLRYNGADDFIGIGHTRDSRRIEFENIRLNALTNIRNQ